MQKILTKVVKNKFNRKILIMFIILILLSINYTFIPQANMTTKSKHFNHVGLQNSDKKEWCLIAYLNGDTGESDKRNVIEYINQLEQIDDNQNIDIIAQIDDDGETRRHHINSGNIWNLDAEKNMGDPDTFTSFVNWAVNNYSAEHYCIVIYGHGGGCLGHSLLPDLSSDSSSMNLTQFEDSLGEIYNNIGKKIDLLIMVPCYMGMIEVCYQIRSYVDYYIAAEAGINACFISLKKVAEILEASSDINKNIVQEIVDESHNDETPVHQHRLVGINPSEIDGIIQDINNLADIGIDCIGDDKAKVAEIRSNYDLSVKNPHPIDLIELLQQYESYFSDKEEECSIIEENINHILIKGKTGYYLDGRKGGVSVYFPPSRNTTDMEEYKKLDFAEDTEWDEFLEEYFDSDDESSNYKNKFKFFNKIGGEVYTFFYDILSKLLKLEFLR